MQISGIEELTNRVSSYRLFILKVNLTRLPLFDYQGHQLDQNQHGDCGEEQVHTEAIAAESERQSASRNDRSEQTDTKQPCKPDQQIAALISVWFHDNLLFAGGI
jgi:hypothetical protein